MRVAVQAGKQNHAPKGRTSSPARSARLSGALLLAEELGLLAGPKTSILRGRIAPKLVAEAKKSSGITSDSRLLEAALASIAVQDDYWEWLNSRKGSVDPEIDLEF